MDRTEKIIQYLIDKYSPSVLISYGSFADGSANAGSDYDALLVYDGRECHDVRLLTARRLMFSAIRRRAFRATTTRRNISECSTER